MITLIPRDIVGESAGLSIPENSRDQFFTVPNNLDGDEKQRLKAELAERFREIATLTVLVGEVELAISQRVALDDWLRSITLLLLKQPRWWGYMPTAWTNRRMRRRLSTHGLFDGPKYLHRYPDVKAAGIDPLLHYIQHGLEEARER